MVISAEIQFAAAVVLIFLIDGVLLLHVNEAVVERGRRVRIAFGSSQPWVAGRRVLMLAPWWPFTSAWRVTWRVRDTLDPPEGANAARARIDALHAQLARLSPWVALSGLLVIVATPVTLIVATTPVFVLVALLAWLSVWLLIVRLAMLRRALGLGWGTYALVAFECVVCPPVAPNLIRKLSLKLSPADDLAAFLDAPTRAAAHAHMAADLDARLVFHEPGSDTFERVRAYRDLLRGDAVTATVSGDAR